jgi:hypothetical protein
MKPRLVGALLFTGLLVTASISAGASSRYANALALDSARAHAGRLAPHVSLHEHGRFADGRTSTGKPQVLPVLRPYIPKLLRSGIPLYLPSWLPQKPNSYVSVTASRGGYQVILYLPQFHLTSPCMQCAFLAIGAYQVARVRPASPFLVTPQTRPVLLHPGGGFLHGDWGYLQPTPFTDHADVLDFLKGPWPSMHNQIPPWYNYHLARLRASLSQFIHIARSMLLVKS